MLPIRTYPIAASGVRSVTLPLQSKSTFTDLIPAPYSVGALTKRELTASEPIPLGASSQEILEISTCLTQVGCSQSSTASSE